MILGLLRFVQSHQCIYIHNNYFSFCEICDSERYRVIVSYSPTPCQQVSDRSFRYYSIQLLLWLIFFVGWLYHILANIMEQASHLLDIHTNMKVRYIDIRNITVWCISLMFIRITFFWAKYEIQNDIGWLLVILLHQVNR